MDQEPFLDYQHLEPLIDSHHLTFPEPQPDLHLDSTEPGIYDSEIPKNSEHHLSRARTRQPQLALFQNKKGANPKKEYVRVKLIRGHKRAIRNSLKGKKAKKTLNAISRTNKQQQKALEVFTTYSKIFQEKMTDLARPESGPKTDGARKRAMEDTEKVDKSFNDGHCRKYFSDRVIRKSFELYCEILFIGCECEELCEKFDFRCCKKGIRHCEECLGKWKLLRTYFSVGMMLELGLGSEMSEGLDGVELKADKEIVV